MKTLRLPFLSASFLFAASLAWAEPQTSVEMTGGGKTAVISTSGKDVLAISENNKTDAIDAAGRDVTINGNGNKLTLRGECHALTVSGNNNTISAESVFSISTPGNGNQVAWRKAGGGGAKPQITDLGKGNTTTQKTE